MSDIKSNFSSNNKRIARNTTFLYLRMFISMSVALYTSRVVLETLGVEDYGIYNIVGGVVAMFSFLNSTMSSATSRFLNYEMGKGNQQKVNDIFSASFWVHVIIAVIIFLLSETVGLWFLHYKMVIPESRILAANVVFQFSLLATIISITQVPYNACLIAHEKMSIYAYVEMINVFLKLVVLYILVVFEYDKLILYGILIFIVSTGVMLFYRFYGINHYEECHLQYKWQPEIVKPMLTFSGWDFYGNMSLTARTQGVAMLLNMYFGPIMNAAGAVATNVQNAIMSFARNVNTAVRPQIVKYYAQGEYKQMESLINNACKVNFFIMSLLMIPICVEIDYILHIWLKDVPQMANVFCIFTLFFNLFSNITAIHAMGIHAFGNVKLISLLTGSLYLSVIPVTYISFELNGEVWIPYLINLLMVIVAVFSNVYILHRYIPEYSVGLFIQSVFSKCLILLLIGFTVALLIASCLEQSFFRLLLTTLSTWLVVGVYGWFVMLPQGIKEKILLNIGKKVNIY